MFSIHYYLGQRNFYHSLHQAYSYKKIREVYGQNKSSIEECAEKISQNQWRKIKESIFVGTQIPKLLLDEILDSLLRGKKRKLREKLSSQW